MKKTKHVNKLIFLIVLITVAFLSMGASSWLIISENSANPAWTLPGEAVTLSLPTDYETYEGERITEFIATSENNEDVTQKGTFSVIQAPVYTGTASTCNATVTVKFTPNSENIGIYRTVTQDVSVTLRAVANVVVNNTTTHYATIEKAMENAQSGATINVIESYEKYCSTKNIDSTLTTSVNAYKNFNALTVMSDRTLSGVTLVLPCADITTETVDDGLADTTDLKHVKQFKSGVFSVKNESTRANNKPTTNLYSNISIASGKTLTNNGTILIGGVISGGGAHSSINSMTVGKYGQITMNSSSNLVNDSSNSKIECYGYIEEQSSKNNSLLQMKKGKLYTMYSVVEHRGGSALLGMVDPQRQDVQDALSAAAKDGLKIPSLGYGDDVPGVLEPNSINCSPFNRFFIESVVPKIIIEQGATVNGYCDLYADGGENCTIMSLVGASSDCILQLTNSNSTIEIKFDKETKVHDLQIYGNMKLNSFSMQLVISKEKEVASMVATSTIQVKLSSRYFHFPIPENFNITFNKFKNNGGNATVDLSSQKIKLLPGSILNIQEGVTVNASEIAIYEDNTTVYNCYGVSGLEYTNTQPAQVNVAGSLTADTLGGKVNCVAENAKLKVNSNNTVVSKEVANTVPGQTFELSIQVIITVPFNVGYTGIEYVDTSLTANGDLYYNMPDTTIATNSQYYGKELTEDSYEWFGAVSQITINYLSNNANVTMTHSNPTTFTISAEAVDLLEPTPSDNAYAFGGWLTSDGNDILELSSTTVYSYVVDGVLTLTADWTQLSKYTVSFDTNNDISGYSYSVDSTEIVEGKQFNLATYSKASVVTGNDTNIEEQWYFDGWYLDEACESQKVESTVTIKAATTLYAKWTKKYSVIIGSTTNGAAITVTINEVSYTSGTKYVKPGVTVDIQGYDEDGMKSLNVNGSQPSITNTSDSKTYKITSYAVNENITITAAGNTGCLVEGTLVTLADGTQKPVEDLTLTDEVLVFNHVTGKIESGRIATIAHANEPAVHREVINLQFNNGKLLRIAFSHALFDIELNKYVFITAENYSEYVGHKFYSVNYVNGEFIEEIIILEKAFVTKETVKAYAPFTYGNANCFADGILNVTSDLRNINAHVNIFELDENMKIDQEKMLADIEKYGLYTYEELKEYATYEQYEALGLAYLKVAVGKGVATFEDIIDIMEYINSEGLIQ